MTIGFWAGLTLGFGIGAATLMLVVLLILSRIKSQQEDMNKEMREFWRKTAVYQRQHIDAMYAWVTAVNAAKSEKEEVKP